MTTSWSFSYDSSVKSMLINFVAAAWLCYIQISVNLYLIEMPFKAFANRANPDQAALLPDQGLLCLLMEIWYISDLTQVDLTSIFFVLCTNMNFYLYNYS